MFLVMSLPTLLFATSDSTYNPPNFDEQVYDVAVPFDDGVSVLVIAALAYGVFKVLAYKKNEKLKKAVLHQ